MKINRDIAYYQDLKLDVYLPTKNNGKTIVHFHGGGLVSGDKSDVEDLIMHFANLGFKVVNANYSLYPTAKFSQYLLDASKAIKYAFDNVSNGDEVYISGQSAGAYIVMMLCLNPEYLSSVGLKPKDIKGYISDSGQMIDHFNVQHYEKGVDPWLQRISELSPMFYVNKDIDCPPILLVYYSNDMLNRKEQNIMLYNLIKFYNKDADITHVELKGDHVEGSCKVDEDGEYPYIKEILKWMKR